MLELADIEIDSWARNKPEHTILPDVISDKILQLKKGMESAYPCGSTVTSTGTSLYKETGHEIELEKAWRDTTYSTSVISFLGSIYSGATSSTSSSVSSLRKLLRMRRRDERLSQLSPERRAIYERIMKLREEIGPVEFDVVEALRELRGND